MNAREEGERVRLQCELCFSNYWAEVPARIHYSCLDAAVSMKSGRPRFIVSAAKKEGGYCCKCCNLDLSLPPLWPPAALTCTLPALLWWCSCPGEGGNQHHDWIRSCKPTFTLSNFQGFARQQQPQRGMEVPGKHPSFPGRRLSRALFVTYMGWLSRSRLSESREVRDN